MIAARSSTTGHMFVTGSLGTTTHCHNNLGYYFGKRLIQCGVMSEGIGPWYALESKVGYSR
jgi:hypothetical protein